LAEHILNRLAAINQIACPRLTPAALERLQEYSFPGNVRELENILERALILCEGGVIDAKDLLLSRVEWANIPQSLAGGPLENRLEDVERQAILQALERTCYNKTAAAKLLGITFRALRYRLKKLELE
jgi:two-component system response regulator PilR (NtrC family)